MIVGLKGFTFLGRIGQYFTDGYFPIIWNWRRIHVNQVIYQYSKHYQVRPFDLIAFSDGGTIAHEMACQDPRCQSLTVHSGIFIPPTHVPPIPIHLLATESDRTGMLQQTLEAFRYYKHRNAKVTLTILESPPKPPYHVFTNGLLSMNTWAQATLNRDLSIKPEYLTPSKVIYQEC